MFDRILIALMLIAALAPSALACHTLNSTPDMPEAAYVPDDGTHCPEDTYTVLVCYPDGKGDEGDDCDRWCV